MQPFSTCMPSTKSTRDAGQRRSPRRHDAVVADAVERLGDGAADAARPPWRRSWRRGAASSRPSTGRAIAQQLGDDALGRLLDAAPQQHRVGALVERAHALAHERLGEQRRGRRPVAGEVGGLVGDLAHELRAHVLELVGELDLAGDRDAVVGDRRRAGEALEDDVAALGAERDLDRVGQLVDAGLQQPPGVVVEVESILPIGVLSLRRRPATRMPRPWSRPWSRSAIASLTASSG